MGLRSEYFARPGKALRPAFFYASYLTFSDPDRRWLGYSQQALSPLQDTDIRRELKFPLLWEIANALEWLHLGIMAVDDAIDHGEHRRGGTSLYRLFEEHFRERIYHLPKERGEYTISPVAAVVNTLTWNMVDLWERVVWVNGQPLESFNIAGQALLMPNGREGHYDFDHQPATHDIFGHLQRVISSVAGWKTHEKSTLQLMQEIYLTALQETLDGEKKDIEWSSRPDFPTIDELFQIQDGKTSWYSVILPLSLGAILGQGENKAEILRALYDLGIWFGRAFQIIDDMLIIEAPDKAGKDTRSDLANGSKTTVIILQGEMMAEPERQEWADLLDLCKTSAEAQGKAIRIIENSGVINRCQQVAAECVAHCDSALATIESLGYDSNLLRQLVRDGLHWMDDAKIDTIDKPKPG
jgi:geranylgeranyl pyrophosphate synthase